LFVAGEGKQVVLTQIEKQVPGPPDKFSSVGLGKRKVLTQIVPPRCWLDAGPAEKFLAGLGKQEVLTRIESSLRWL
jgi:hypothetical protein